VRNLRVTSMLLPLTPSLRYACQDPGRSSLQGTAASSRRTAISRRWRILRILDLPVRPVGARMRCICRGSSCVSTGCPRCSPHTKEHHVVCNAAWHMSCLPKPLFRLPRRNWMYPNCTSHRQPKPNRAVWEEELGSPADFELLPYCC